MTATGGHAAGRPVPCPRCRTLVPASAVRCPSCGVPQQVFDIVTADEGAEDSGAGGQVHAIVLRDTCIGCGSCVAACDEAGAIRLVNKMAVVDRDKCVGHGMCAQACPVGGITLSTGAAVQRVEVPLLDSTFQSNVAGVYVVGELGGRGLIKNAINEARIAIEAIAHELAAEPDRGRDPDLLDVVIVGAGPAGLSSGLSALKCGLSYALLERGSIADSIRKYPRHKLLLAEPVSIPLYGELWLTDASKETLLEVWETIIAATGLQVRTGCEVEDVRRHASELLVKTAAGPLRARRVVLAIGRRGTPRRLEVPGADRPEVYYDITEVSEFQGSRTVVVGGGDSAIESAVGLANQPDTTVCLVHRGTSFEKAKARNREHLDQALAQGKLRLLLNAQVREIREGEVLVTCTDGPVVVPSDSVIVRIGGEAPVEFLDRVGVRRVKKDLAIAAPVFEEALVA
ncbi:MAG: NAD(P)-binding domain-containing protein [Deltaproteobacteria bacterium]|nr:NAD(P)-binding domain-containing protein [Deltaproteobacteria bacterium]